MKKIGCGQAAVYNALAFRTNSKLAGDIRSLATNIYGGVQVSERVLVR